MKIALTLAYMLGSAAAWNVVGYSSEDCNESENPSTLRYASLEGEGEGRNECHAFESDDTATCYGFIDGGSTHVDCPVPALTVLAVTGEGWYQGIEFFSDTGCALTIDSVDGTSVDCHVIANEVAQSFRLY